MKKMNRKRLVDRLKESKGVSLITSYLFISTLLIFSLGLYSYSITFSNAAERNKNRIVAFNFSEAGFNDAFVELKNNTISTNPAWQTVPCPSPSPPPPPSPSPSPSPTPTCWQRSDVSMSTGNIEGGYDVTVENLGGNQFQISATGYSPAKGFGIRGQEFRNIIGYVGPGSLFEFAAFAQDQITLDSNITIDSYDSGLGAYDPLNPGANGDVGTDSTADATVILDSGATVNGDVTVGPGGNPSTVIDLDPNATITGSQKVAASTQSYQPLTTNIPSSGNLTIGSNAVYVFNGGTYRFDSIDMDSNSSLVTNGSVTIYVDGEVNIDSNVAVNVGQAPTDFFLYVTTSDDVRLDSNVEFYGAIYAPASNVQIDSNVDLFGAVVAKTYNQDSNTQLHYDEALGDYAPGSNPLRLRSWRETNTAAGS